MTMSQNSQSRIFLQIIFALHKTPESVYYPQKDPISETFLILIRSAFFLYHVHPFSHLQQGFPCRFFLKYFSFWLSPYFQVRKTQQPCSNVLKNSIFFILNLAITGPLLCGSYSTQEIS